MSSFIVSAKTMNNIVNGLYWDSKFRSLYSHLYKEFGLEDTKDFQRLGDDLLNLNALATGVRYANEKKLKTILVFKWNADHTVSKLQVLKSMHCLRYQCAEAAAIDTELFRWLEKVIRAFESFVINEIDGYKRAEWD